MKKFLFLIVIIVLASYTTEAQQLEFKKNYSTTGPSNQGTSIIEQSNGDFIISGIRSVPIGTQFIANVILFRTNSMGDTLWTKEIGTATDRELAYNMIQLPDGKLVIFGSINIPPNGLSDALIICTDVNGNVQWQKQYGGSNSDYATCGSFDGQNIIVSGITESYGAGNSDAWLLKLNLSGDTLWSRTYGGAEIDDAWSIIVAHNQYIFTGGTYSYASGQFDDAWIVKTDTAGNLIWRKTYGVMDRVDWAWEIIATKNNGTIDGYAFVGVKNTMDSQPGNVYGDMHFVKVDTSGAIIWDQSIPGTPYRREGINIAQFADGGFLLSGYKLEPAVQSQQLHVVKTDASGNVIWDTAIGTSDSNYTANAMTLTSDGGWAITGSVFHPSQPIRYIYIAKFTQWPLQIDEIEKIKKVVVYPNPVTNGLLHFRVAAGEKINSVMISSLDGKMLKKYEDVSNNSISINDFTGWLIVDIHTNHGVSREKILHLQ